MAGPSKLYVKQIQIKAAAHTSFLKMCSDYHRHRFECMQKHHQWKEQRKTSMYLEASRRITIEILNVCGRFKGNKKIDFECIQNQEGKTKCEYHYVLEGKNKLIFNIYQLLMHLWN
jgi:hypothetical protein